MLRKKKIKKTGEGLKREREIESGESIDLKDICFVVPGSTQLCLYVSMCVGGDGDG